MTRSLPFLLLLCACGESSHANRSPLAEELFVPPECGDEPLPPRMDADGEFYSRETVGYPFLGALRYQDERSSATLSVPQAGTICLRGTVAAVAAGQFPFAQLILALEEYSLDGKCRWPLLDARAFGATSLRFSLDEVPDTHLFLTAAVFQRAECPENPFGCVAGGTYTLRANDREDLSLLQPGVNLAPFEAFVGDELSLPLDASLLSLFSLRLAPTNRALDFGFCLSELAFLDAAGHEVEPRPRVP